MSKECRVQGEVDGMKREGMTRQEACEALEEGEKGEVQGAREDWPLIGEPSSIETRRTQVVKGRGQVVDLRPLEDTGTSLWFYFFQ